jgi:hypothetical protein
LFQCFGRSHLQARGVHETKDPHRHWPKHFTEKRGLRRSLALLQNMQELSKLPCTTNRCYGQRASPAKRVGDLSSHNFTRQGSFSRRGHMIIRPH